MGNYKLELNDWEFGQHDVAVTNEKGMQNMILSEIEIPKSRISAKTYITLLDDPMNRSGLSRKGFLGVQVGPRREWCDQHENASSNDPTGWMPRPPKVQLRLSGKNSSRRRWVRSSTSARASPFTQWDRVQGSTPSLRSLLGGTSQVVAYHKVG